MKTLPRNLIKACCTLLLVAGVAACDAPDDIDEAPELAELDEEDVLAELHALNDGDDDDAIRRELEELLAHDDARLSAIFDQAEPMTPAGAGDITADVDPDANTLGCLTALSYSSQARSAANSAFTAADNMPAGGTLRHICESEAWGAKQAADAAFATTSQLVSNPAVHSQAVSNTITAFVQAGEARERCEQAFVFDNGGANAFAASLFAGAAASRSLDALFRLHHCV